MPDGRLQRDCRALRAKRAVDVLVPEVPEVRGYFVEMAMEIAMPQPAGGAEPGTA